jgi:hypothetical protein
MAEVTIREDKFTRLAEAIPAEKYTWRPAPDVRSFAEVFMYVSAANFNLYRHGAEHLGQSIAYARFVGITPPWTEDMQKKQPEKK